MISLLGYGYGWFVGALARAFDRAEDAYADGWRDSYGTRPDPDTDPDGWPHPAADPDPAPDVTDCSACRTCTDCACLTNRPVDPADAFTLGDDPVDDDPRVAVMVDPGRIDIMIDRAMYLDRLIMNDSNASKILARHVLYMFGRAAEKGPTGGRGVGCHRPFEIGDDHD